MSVRLPRCARGTRRNKKTGLCEKTQKSPGPTKKSPVQATRKRCPNGSRKNPKTGECVKTKSANTLLNYFAVSKIGKGKKPTGLKIRRGT